MINWPDSKKLRQYDRDNRVFVQNSSLACVTQPNQATIQAMVLLSLIFIFTIIPAHAGVTVAPLRGVISIDQPKTTITISNPSQTLLEVNVTLLDLKATPVGYQLADSQHREKISAAPWLIMSPTRFTLEPGARQNVTISLRDNFTLPMIEKRTHLYIETVPTRGRVHPISVINDNSTGLSLDAHLGISIPLILRKKTVPAQTAQISFENTKLVRDKRGFLSLKTDLIANTPSWSLVGDIEIAHSPYDKDQKALSLQTLYNIALYTDSLKRSVTIPLHQKSLKPARLTLTYKGRDEYAGRKLAKRVFDIGE